MAMFRDTCRQLPSPGRSAAALSRKRARGRRGVSLLEVLISVFVFLFGLLSVAALLPVGRSEIAQVQTNDRVSRCGRAARNEIYVRGMLNPNGWFGMGLQPGEDRPILIDPIGFWYMSPQFPAAGGIVSIPRVTLRVLPDGSSSLIGLVQSKRICEWQDDLTFHYPEEKTLRPLQQFRLLNGEVEHDPTSPNMVNPLVAEHHGEFSWMALVEPSRKELGLAKRMYTVSIAVYQKREFTPALDQELQCSVRLPPGATRSPVLLGGGDLVFDTTNVKAGQWVLLCGPKPNGMPTMKWYHVVAVDPMSNDQQSYVTLSGPDWDATPLDPADVRFTGNPIFGYNSATSDVRAIILNNVIGVYTETIEVDN